MMQEALISKIQRYSTKDGPGLRTTVFFMGCNLRCLWCANPENLKQQPQIFYFKERCQHCGLCVHQAHHHSITFDTIGCHIDRETCDNLFDMVDICPFDCYEKIGQVMTSDELVCKLLRDQDFYKAGQGGVTFSGGEAALQADFIEEVAHKLHQHHIHTCLDTAGHIETQRLLQLLKHIDMVLYDIKAIDETMHKNCTGISNQLILSNAKAIANNHIPMIIRLVIVPGYNDDIDDMKKRIDFICSLGTSVKQVDILKYHIYGIGKYEKLGLTYPLENLEINENKIQDIYNYALSRHLKVTIGG